MLHVLACPGQPSVILLLEVRQSLSMARRHFWHLRPSASLRTGRPCAQGHIKQPVQRRREDNGLVAAAALCVLLLWPAALILLIRVLQTLMATSFHYPRVQSHHHGSKLLSYGLSVASFLATCEQTSCEAMSKPTDALAKQLSAGSKG